MGLVDSQLQQDFIFNLDPDLMPGSRAVTLRFKNNTTRAINAQVFEYEVQFEGQRESRRVFLIGVANDSTYGLSAAEFDNNGVKASLSFRGGTAADYTLRWPTSSDPVPVNEPVDDGWCWYVAS